MQSLRLLTISLLVLCSAAFAEASTGVRVVGDPKLRALATKRIVTWLVDHDHQVDDALGQAALTALDLCYRGNDLACANKVFTSNSKADLYVLVDLVVTGAEGREREVQATLWLLKAVGAPQRHERSCRGCDDEGAADMIDALVAHVGSFDNRAGVLRVSSEPAGALVRVDGKRAGATPLDSEQRPGKHELEVSRPGYFSETRSVEVVAGETHEEIVDLRRQAAPMPAWRKPVMYGAAAAGVLALVGGVVALSINEGDRCAPDKEQCLYTLPGGVAALVGGSLALGGAGYLWFTRESEPDTAAALGPRRGRGVGLGWTVRF